MAVIKGRTGDWEYIIGLEVHCQIISEAKLFSGASTKFGDKPNNNVSFFDAAFPGTLPVMNAKCAEQAVRTGLGLNASINKVSQFDRKNYFYPDNPSGYQITQLYKPVVTGGYIDIEDENNNLKRIRIDRLHIETDAGKSVHDRHQDKTCVDLNRAGVGLMEIVSCPDLRSPYEAGQYLKKLRAIVRYLGTCDGNMDEGSMRCDANVSMRKTGETEFRTRVEVKNVNSVKFVMQAIETEGRRQIKAYESGKEIIQETRLYDADKNETRSMRTKEFAHDYRYYPDPDLPPLVLTDGYIEAIRKTLPELPDARKKRYIEELKLTAYDAEVLTADKESADYFERAAKGRDAKKVANWIMGDLFALLKVRNLTIDKSPVSPENLGALAGFVADGTVTINIAKEVFAAMAETGDSPEKIIAERGLQSVNDNSEIEKVIDGIISGNPDKVAEFRSGKDKLIAWFVGQVMKATQGKAAPAIVNDLLIKKLKG